MIIQLRYGMFALANACLLLKATLENFHVDNLISQAIIAWQEVSTEHANCGMSEADNALKHSEVIMMKYLMHASILLVINSQQQVLMALPEYTMCLQEHVSHYYKVTRMKYQRFPSIHRATRLLLLVVIRHAVYGQ